jgi:hypothetical protein
MGRKWQKYHLWEILTSSSYHRGDSTLLDIIDMEIWLVKLLLAHVWVKTNRCTSKPHKVRG